jgi:hypothetical protein
MPFGIRLVPGDQGFPDRNDCKSNFLPDGAPLITLITEEEKEPWSILVRSGFRAVPLGKREEEIPVRGRADELEYENDFRATGRFGRFVDFRGRMNSVTAKAY